MRPKLFRWMLYVCLFGGLVSAGACSNPISDVEIQIINPCTIQSGSTTPITVGGRVARDVSVLWRASAGSFEDEAQRTTDYFAPIVNEQSIVRLTVTVTEGRQDFIQSVDCTVLPSTASIEPGLEPTPITVEITVPSSTATSPSTDVANTPAPTATTEASPVVQFTYVPGALGGAESRGVCGNAAFDDQRNTNNPTFTRPVGHPAGWLSSDEATLVLPDGSTRYFPVPFVLIVEDASFVELRDVTIGAQAKANIWGCWFREGDHYLAPYGAVVDYQKKIAQGLIAEIHRFTGDGLKSFDVDSDLSVYFRTIPAFAINGVEWCAAAPGRYTIAYDQGAYSGWPNDAACPNNECWKTAVAVYNDRNIEWVDRGNGIQEPGNYDLLIGWEFPALSTYDDAVSRSRTTASETIDLDAGDCVTFVTNDSRTSYGDNRGDVTYSISFHPLD